MTQREVGTMSNTMKYACAKELKILHAADCIVVGGGPAGCAAAIMATRQGMNVLLLERYGFAGGAAVSQLVPVVLSQNGKDFPPIWHEWMLEMKRIGKVREMVRREQQKHWFSATYAPESAKQAWDNLLDSAGVHVLFHAQVIDVVKADRRIEGLVVATRGGEYAVTGKVFIDCTGDGTLSFLAGEAYSTGGAIGPVSQACTKMFRLINATKPELVLNEQNTARLIEDFQRALKDSEFSSPVITSGYVLKYILGRAGKQLPDGTLLINATRLINVDSLDPWQLSAAEREGRRSASECAEFFMKYVPGCEQAEFLDTSIELGVRASRRILCHYELTIDDILSFRRFDDSIAQGSWEIDVHSPDNYDYGTALRNSERYDAYRVRIVGGDCYQIPLRCLVARETRNLLVAGRCIGSDDEAQGTVRIQQTCMSTGTAAGAAAALAVKEKVDCQAVGGLAVQRLLLQDENHMRPAFSILENC